MKSLAGKHAVVTGSTSGIGLGIAEVLAAEGASVTLNGFGDAEAIARLCARVTAETGVEVAYDPADLSDGAAVRGLVAAAEARFGAVDILVNNAGVQYVAPIEEFPVERWNAIIALNLSAVFHATAAALPGMRSRGFGRIVNIASAHGLVGSAGKAAYVAAKHGVVGLTKVTALETATSPVTCNAICPGFVLTPLVQTQIDAYAQREGLDGAEARRRFLAEKQPSLEFATPAQIGAIAAFLASPAAAQIRGASMTVDGGWTAQ
jgi:3-hydroxybutyrate dehydrogenase